MKRHRFFVADPVALTNFLFRTHTRKQRVPVFSQVITQAQQMIWLSTF
jgi:hypothetical protein